MDSPTSILSWPHLIAGTIIAAISAAAGYLISWRKLPSEIEKTDADADYTRAQAADLRFKTRLSAMEMFEEMAADLSDERFEKIRLRERNAQLEAEVQTLTLQNVKMKGICDANGILIP